ncbi:hypothetical protein ACFPMF_00515 [Larkinella bovis]|uniref:Uncharacterized protein n=1 Tax=Larkinella bovis TaxID=683041 RepID=A0ABW0I2M8_9BACT
MHYDPFFFLSCILGDELYKLNFNRNKPVDYKQLMARFNQVCDQPIDDFYLSGLPPIIRQNARRNNAY